MSTVEQLEIDLLLEGIYQHYGYDFRHYARASLKRRLEHCLMRARRTTISELLPMVLHDKGFFESLLLDLSINVTEMFRDPDFFIAFREHVVPHLKTWPFIKIWHAGCSTGEEVYSLAIVLYEEGILDRCQIYATDFNGKVIEKAREGIYPLDVMPNYTVNYQSSDGRRAFSDYYTARYGNAKIAEFLKQRITFANHNLATDSSFGEMNVILCRNVLIYFDSTLQQRALSIFQESLCHGGFLCLGTKESTRCINGDRVFEALDAEVKIYRKTTPKAVAPHA